MSRQIFTECAYACKLTQWSGVLDKLIKGELDHEILHLLRKFDYSVHSIPPVDLGIISGLLSRLRFTSSSIQFSARLRLVHPLMRSLTENCTELHVSDEHGYRRSIIRLPKVYYIRNFEPNETLEGHYISWLKF
jgi:hypothetical protein